MFQDSYFVDKTTDTFADTLLAYGLASLLDNLLSDNFSQAIVRIRDAGSAFVIALEFPIADGFEFVDWFCDLPFIETPSQKPPKGWPAKTIDYEREKAHNAEFYRVRDQLPPAAKRLSATIDDYPELAQLEGLKPRHDWKLIVQINQMGGITAYNRVLGTWFDCRKCLPELVRTILALFAVTPNNVNIAMSTWKSLKKEHKLRAEDKITTVQILNPAMGKGLNRVKAAGAAIPPPLKSFWLLEFLKFWGMYVAGIPRTVRPATPAERSQDLKVYVPRPVNLTLKTHTKVFRTFNERMWPATAIKMDIMAAIRYMDVFLSQWLAGQLSDTRWDEESGNHVSGLTAAFYKDMGSAKALLNMSEIALPRWMTVENIEQGKHYQNVLEEHQQIVSSLEERYAEQYNLLVNYRDFLSGQNLDMFFKFCGAYSTLLMSRIEKGQWVPQFSTSNLEVLIMSHDRKLKHVVDSRGFQNIARAIRLSTVRPQYRKARGERGPYDVRYGLGTDLLRTAAYSDRFIQALGEFMHAFNQENAQVYERAKGDLPVRSRRTSISTEDIADVVDLIDEYGSQTVGNLLIAYGYAQEPWEQRSENRATENTEDDNSTQTD